MTMKKITTTAAILAAGTSTAFAGGLDRSTFSSAILFEKGTYAEIAYGVTTPKVSAANIPNTDIAQSFNTVKIGFKTDIGKKIAVALTYNNQPIGSDINYAGTTLGPATGNLAANVQAVALTLLGKYKATDNFSVYGGLKYQTVSATANIALAGLTTSNFASESEVGYIAGVAYEKPEIALRVALSYESEIEYQLNTTGGASTGITNASTPSAWTLEFQTGVAPKTLVFGSIRHANWGDSNIISPAGAALTEFEDTTAYTLGVGRKFTDNVSGSFALFYEAPDGGTSSELAPTDGIFGGTVGVAVKMGKGFKVSGGISYSNRGDTTGTNTAVAFGNNSVTTVGIKLSKNF
ncbi:hypothetical protein F9L33_02825 [Amylibacter sp. SFDW26]|uniref:hypothetical protein n=1 Tax=Amylibacter sp. SFDW26 TaxID=2652722 RepID=UPI001261BB4F|nr:hypothetical protein [Amylibacter sp. SFDW26]KAB7615713.1 hypothetical protein F9L33_02825 [Amylibacter sp. SFDW26]